MSHVPAAAAAVVEKGVGPWRSSRREAASKAGWEVAPVLEQGAVRASSHRARARACESPRAGRSRRTRGGRHRPRASLPCTATGRQPPAAVVQRRGQRRRDRAVQYAARQRERAGRSAALQAVGAAASGECEATWWVAWDTDGYGEGSFGVSLGEGAQAVAVMAGCGSVGASPEMDHSRRCVLLEGGCACSVAQGSKRGGGHGGEFVVGSGGGAMCRVWCVEGGVGGAILLAGVPSSEVGSGFAGATQVALDHRLAPLEPPLCRFQDAIRDVVEAGDLDCGGRGRALSSVSILHMPTTA